VARRGNPKGKRRRSPEGRVLRNAENIEEWRILNSLSVKKRKKKNLKVTDLPKTLGSASSRCIYSCWVPYASMLSLKGVLLEPSHDPPCF
jgi:hypothetical protein